MKIECSTCIHFEPVIQPREFQKVYDNRKGEYFDIDMGPGRSVTWCDRFNTPIDSDDGCIKGWKPRK